MSIFNVVKSILSTESADKDTELNYLRALHEKQTGTMPRSWYRVVNAAGYLVGFCYVCACGTTYELLSTEQWFGKTNTCPGCKHEFDLFKSLAIPAGTALSDYPKFFAKIPLTPRLTQTKPQPSAMQVGDWGDSAEASDWGGDKAAAARADINNGLF
jgi:hypothetical protein